MGCHYVIIDTMAPFECAQAQPEKSHRKRTMEENVIICRNKY